LLSRYFAQLRVFGDIPFRGRVMGQFGASDDSETELDCSLVQQDEPPTALVAVCSAEALESNGYLVVQLPNASPPGGVAPSAAGAEADAVVLEQSKPRWAEGLTRALDRANMRIDRERLRADQERAARTRQDLRLSALQERFEAQERVIARLRGDLDQQQQRAERAESRCDLLIERLGRGAGEFQRLEAKVAELQAAHLEQQWRADELQGRLMLADRRLEEARRSAKQPATSDEPSGEERAGPRQEVERLREEVARLRTQLGTATVALAELEQLRLAAAQARPAANEPPALARATKPKRAAKASTRTRKSKRSAASRPAKGSGRRDG
jgi:uncharacterized coiled-coil protein SlyX